MVPESRRAPLARRPTSVPSVEHGDACPTGADTGADTDTDTDTATGAATDTDTASATGAATGADTDTGAPRNSQ
jgi:hypothetical protein